MLSYGEGEAEIVDWGIFDKDGEYQPTINNNDVYTVKVKIKFNKEIDEPIFAMSVKDIKGLELGGVNTKAYKVLTGTYQPGDEVVVEYRQQFPLAPERYAFSFGCTKFKQDGSLQVFDRKYDALLFEIVGYRDCLGIIDFKTDINIIRSNNNES
jgi:teichoic acid transport system ATP-binding protein